MSVFFFFFCKSINSLSFNLMFILQIVEGNALPNLILMLRSEDVGIHYEAV